MQSPFSPHAHYHPYFQLQPPGAQDLELKRQYLSLLPPKQIIEICLAFDAYVPPYAKTTIWPSDLNAAIANLQNIASSSSSENSSSAGKSKDGPVIVSLPEASQAQESSAIQSENTNTAEPPPLNASASGTVSATLVVGQDTVPASEIAQNASSETASDLQERPSEPQHARITSSPTIQVQTEQPPQISPSYPPHHTYGYGHPHQYPHTPYYASAFPYPYSYPPSNGFHSAASGATPYAPQATPYGGMPVPLHQPQPDATAIDDLPSYEDMIVEALSECTDSEGSMPKDLFAWMAARYPLQSNFRPSASQALQKAYKRGRFEKASNGKYRLNATWGGGSTSRRTTRRPQTQSHAASGATNRAPVPPFTHAPLVHHRNSSHSSSQPPYPPHPYGYPGYPAYGSQLSIADTSSAPATASGPSHLEAKSGPTACSTTESAAAYEAAQSILKAINFGSLLKLSPEENEKRTEEAEPQPPQSVGDGIEHLLSHVQAVLAGRTSEESNTNTLSAPAGESIFSPPLPIPPHGSGSTDARAELQAQLALLSAQLVELAQSEDPPATESRHVAIPTPTSPIPLMHSLRADPPVPLPSQLSSVNPDAPSTSLNSHVCASSTVDNLELATSPQDDGESDENDMEEVI